MPDIWGSPTWTNTDPRLQQALQAMMADAPGAIGLTSGWRSNAQQRALYAQKPGLAAKPGSSNHEFGLAADITFANASVRAWAHANARRYGLWFPMDYEPWHIQLVGVDRHNAAGGAPMGGGRDAFSSPPDGRFGHPYDGLSGAMSAEDPTDPLVQFERLVGAISSPTRPGALDSPDVPGLASPQAPKLAASTAGPMNQTYPGDALNQEAGSGAVR